MPRRTLMIGDSANDVAAARAARVPVWCVDYGYREGESVESLGADRIVASVREAAAALLAAAPGGRRGGANPCPPVVRALRPMLY